MYTYIYILIGGPTLFSGPSYAWAPGRVGPGHGPGRTRTRVGPGPGPGGTRAGPGGTWARAGYF